MYPKRIYAFSYNSVSFFAVFFFLVEVKCAAESVTRMQYFIVMEELIYLMMVLMWFYISTFLSKWGKLVFKRGPGPILNRCTMVLLIL